jgi:hypothetical protein
MNKYIYACNYAIQSEIDKGKCRSRGIKHFPLELGRCEV